MAQDNDLFFTSKGPRRFSQIRQVDGGSHVRRSDIGWETRTLDTEAWISLDHSAIPSIAARVAAGGWQSWASWKNTSVLPIATFEAQWTVPKEPAIANGQTIYLFNGVQDVNGIHIVQPVLQWGRSPAIGSTNAWGLASFWVGGDNDPMFTTHWAAVAPGTVVTGRMTITAQDNGLFSCTCEFANYPSTQLTAENLPPLVDCVLTLEAYATGTNAPYPGVSITEFSGVILTPAGVASNVRWSRNGGALIKKDGGNGACIDVVYPSAGS